MLHPSTTVVFAVLSLVLWYWKRKPRPSLSDLPGPPFGSWFVGIRPSFDRGEDAAGPHFEWTKKYGNAFRVKGCFGEDVLYLADPKAMQYVLNKSGYKFSKTREARVTISLITGRGIVAVDGAEHARHRRVMNPSFSQSALKGFLPLFLELSRKTTDVWKTMIRKQNGESCILDIASLMARTTLDIIGEAAFGYKFNSIEVEKPMTELQKAYENLFVDANYMISDFEIMFRRILGYAPFWISNVLTALPKKDLQKLNNCTRAARKVARDLVEKEMKAHASGKEGGNDVMSIFVRANNAEDPKRRLELNEILPQITTLLLAGHETTASSLGWALYELSKHPEVQHKLREEIRATQEDIASRGSEMAISDLESMTFTVAVVKETLRYHPIVPHIYRQADQDDVIPLETPQQTATGDIITTIPVQAGQPVQLALAAYNRLTSVWGADADEWRPERFLEEKSKNKKTTLGVFANLCTFSSGVRNCIGWRFAVLEMQALLIELIDNFDFSPVPNIEIKRAASGIMQSMVKGQEHKGAQLPLKVSIVSKRDAD